MTLWRMLAAFFCLAIDDDPPADDPPADDSPPDDPPADDLPPDDAPADDPTPNTEAQTRAELDAERRGRQEAEERARVAQQRLDDATRQSRQGLDEESRLRAEEDARLARITDPKEKDLHQWQIDSSRTLRASNQNSARALAAAHDVSDKTNFEAKCAQNKRLASVKADVDTRAAEMQARGQPVPNREAMAYFLLGQKVANAPAIKAKAPVPRGQPTNARSDIRRGGAMTDRQKRAAKLENQII